VKKTRNSKKLEKAKQKNVNHKIVSIFTVITVITVMLAFSNYISISQLSQKNIY